MCEYEHSGSRLYHFRKQASHFSEFLLEPKEQNKAWQQEFNNSMI